MGSGFTFWLDEILWSQGRVAVELIEEVLWQLGGRRTGGPIKKLPQRLALGATASTQEALGHETAPRNRPTSAEGRAGVTTHTHNSNQQQQQEEDSGTPQEASQRQQEQQHLHPQQQQQHQQQHPHPPQQQQQEPWRHQADATTLGLAARNDEHWLGYCHVDKWQFLWTKSVYGIKAARGMQQGQVVSAIAGLNSLTMKKKMILTLKQVSYHAHGC
jgi:hypothetical protein